MNEGTLKELKNSKRKIFIRGAGNYGIKLFFILMEQKLDVEAFIDINPDMVGAECLNRNVLSPQEVYEAFPVGSYFILSAIKEHYEGVRLEMENHHLTEFADFEDFTDYTDVMMARHDRNKYYRYKGRIYSEYFSVRKTLTNLKLDEHIFDSEIYISDLDLVVTEYCNLNCNGCSHLMPYIKAPKHFDARQMVRDFERVLSVSKIFVVGLMGGEPLVYPHIAEMLDMIAKMEHIKNVQVLRIVTNGAVPIQEKVLNSLKKLPVPYYIYVSNYKEKSKYSRQIAKLCDRFDVPCYLQEFDYEWNDFGDPRKNNNYSREKLEELYQCCAVANNCFQLIDGQFYSCARIPVLIREGFVPFEPEAFVDVRQTDRNEMADKLHSFIYDTKYLDACQNCLGQLPDSIHIQKAE